MQIIYFPYLNLKGRDELKFGDIRIWNFDTKKESEITDTALLEKINKLIYSNVSNNNPLKGIGIMSIDKTDFREFTPEEIHTADELRLLLFLSFISRNNVNATGPNAGHYVATSENFTYVIQNFDPLSDYIAQRNGFLVKKLDFGYKIGELLFHKPPYVPEPLGFGIDEELVTELLKIKKTNNRSYERILRATDLLFESFFNDPFVSLNARLLLQVCSFEVLLNLPDDGKQRMHFKEEIEKYTVRKNEKCHLYTSERPKKNVKESSPLKVVWADKLYTLRNHIIHGSKISENEFHFKNKQHFLDITPLFFVLLIKEIINKKRKRKKKYFNDDIKWGKYENGNGDNSYGFIYNDTTVVRSLSKKFAEAYKKSKVK